MYSRTVWQDLPSTQTPITAGRLNNMENGIEENDTAIGKELYDSTSTYAVGDYCIYNHTLYQCNTKIATAEEWNPSHWTAVTIVSKLKQNYSTTEQIVGNWMSGEPLYMKVVDIGYLLNTGTKTVSLDLPSDAFIVKAEAYFFVGTTFATLPYVSTQAGYSIDFFIDNGNAIVTTYRDRRTAYARTIIYYIKTND